MKTIIINLNITSMPQSTQPTNITPCPRVNVFQDPINPADITQVGNYNYSIELEDNGRCGVDVFAWKNNNINISTDLPILIRPAGRRLDQIRKTINIAKAGTYNISVSIS